MPLGFSGPGKAAEGSDPRARRPAVSRGHTRARRSGCTDGSRTRDSARIHGETAFAVTCHKACHPRSLPCPLHPFLPMRTALAAAHSRILSKPTCKPATLCAVSVLCRAAFDDRAGSIRRSWRPAWFPPADRGMHKTLLHPHRQQLLQRHRPRIHPTPNRITFRRLRSNRRGPARVRSKRNRRLPGRASALAGRLRSRRKQLRASHVSPSQP